MSLIKLAYNLEESFEPQTTADGFNQINNTNQQIRTTPVGIYDRIPLKLKLQMLQKRRNGVG